MINLKTRLDKLEQIVPPGDELIKVGCENYTSEEWQAMKDRGEIITVIVKQDQNKKGIFK